MTAAPLKNRPFPQRLRFALQGIRSTWQTEASFRTQAICGVLALAAAAALRPTAVWWALLSLTISAVLAAELLNTAFERLIDHLHPEQHPAIGMAKDIAAGAVLFFSLASVAVFACLLVSRFG